MRILVRKERSANILLYAQEPQSLYGEVRSYPLSRLDRNISSESVLEMVQEEESKLPATIDLTWPEGEEIQRGQVCQAGLAIGGRTSSCIKLLLHGMIFQDRYNPRKISIFYISISENTTFRKKLKTQQSVSPKFCLARTLLMIPVSDGTGC